jgi:hypothetical protein
VSRRQYISGLLGGVAFAAVLYCFAMGLTGTWVMQEIGFPPSRLWFLMAALLTACLLGAAVAVFFSVFLNPLFTTGATFTLLAVPMVLGRVVSHEWVYAIPVYPLVEKFLTFSLDEPLGLGWGPIVLGLLETIAIWLIASWTFDRKDIAVAIE